MELNFGFYKVFIKNQSLYNPIFLQDLVLNKILLNYPMAPSVTFGDSSLPEGAKGNGVGGCNTAAGGARVPRSEPASFGGSEHAPPLRTKIPIRTVGTGLPDGPFLRDGVMA